ncbi:MAG: M1 family aminopeptidase [Pyrinomonadaceae bacterium]
MRVARFIRSAASFALFNMALMLALYVAPHGAWTRTLAQTSAPAQETSARQSLPPAQYIPSHDYDVRNITLNLHFDWQREQAIGTATLTFAPLVKDLRRVELDAGNMTFNSIKLVAPNVPVTSGTPLKFALAAPREKLIVELDRAYQPTDVLTIIFDYHTNGVVKESGIGGAYGRGLAFIKPTKDEPKRPRQIWSQGESEYNHYWFPCYDHPNDFSTSELIATVDKPYTVISNGQLVEQKDNPDNTRTFHWKTDVPHASYLISIVVGEYTPVEAAYAGIPINTYVYPSEVKEGRITAARIADMVQFFSERTGVKYPYAKYAQTVARDFGGGMENISATTLTDMTIHDARTELDRTSDSLLSHELAHQWFGDYVTSRNWSDIWLNESFATYFQALYDEHNLGRDEFLYRDVRNNQNEYLEAWRRGLRRPIVTKNYTEPDAVFDVYAYPRGGAVLHMLRRYLGDENWWRAINHYLTKYAHQPVETAQFRIAIEEATGQPLEWFFDQWLYKMGHPIFYVTKSYDQAAKTLTLNVAQAQKIDPTSAFPQAALFRVPVDIEIGAAGGKTRIERVIIEPKETQTFSFKLDGEPQLVNFDYGGALIKEVRFDKPASELVYQLTNDEDLTGRLWALERLRDRLKDSGAPEAERAQVTAAIGGALLKDKFWGVRAEAAASLKGINNAAARDALLAATKDAKSAVRAAAIESLSPTRDAMLAGVYEKFLDDPSYAVIGAASQALGETKAAGAYAALSKLLEVPSWRDTIRISALNGLGTLGDARALDAALRYSTSGNATAVRLAAISLLGGVGKNDPRVFQRLAETFTQAFTASNKTLITNGAEALVALGDPRGLEVFESVRRKANSKEAATLLVPYEERLRTAQTATPKPAGK